MRNAQSDARGRRWIERQQKSGDTPAVYVDRHRQIGPAQRLAVCLIDENNIDGRMIDLQHCHWCWRFRRLPGCGLQPPRRFASSATLPTLGGFLRSDRLHASANGVGCRRCNACGRASFSNRTHDSRRALFLTRQKFVPDRLADDGLDHEWQTRFTLAPGWRLWSQRTQKSARLTISADQRINGSLGEAEFGSSLPCQSRRYLCMSGKRCDNRGTTLRLDPGDIREAQDPLGNLGLIWQGRSSKVCVVHAIH
ncbi:hypothetical protein SAMN05518861_15110 [Mesorhizobium sp. YR577]|nr:hypothetical protein SAMN05518861_15110 [Mesorhizobium sp. YR577]